MTETESFESQIPAALATTGFVVEHEVSEAFRADKWNVIGSRYYIDDVDGRARELDLIAYKVVPGLEIDVVTSILISCKKDQENAWTVLSRGRPAQDPNLDWNPVHPWTNNDLLHSYLESISWSEEYVRGDKNLFANLFELKRQAFAFQLISKKTCKPKNDRPIFESLTDLMKAQDHELSILPDRMKKKRLYTFNLLAIVDAPIYEVHYDQPSPVAIEVSEFRHLARYIVNKRERVARINIYSKAKLRECVSTYSSLAIYDHTFFNQKIKEAYAAVKTNTAVQAVFSKEMTKKLKWDLMYSLARNNRKSGSTEVSIEFDKKKEELIISTMLNEDDVLAIAHDDLLLAKVKDALKSIARFEGRFRIEADIPF